MDCWQSAAYKKDKYFIDLPYLLAPEFAKFYQCALSQVEQQSEEGVFSASDAEKESELFMNTVLFNTEKEHQVYRTRICWLEYWVYTCARGDAERRGN